MRKRVLGLGVAITWLVGAGVAEAATDVPGGTIADQTWTAAGSPYVVHGDLTVPAGVTLRVEAGTEVKFEFTDETPSGTSQRIELIVEGSLLVSGTLASPVTFRSSLGFSGGWTGIEVKPAATSVIIEGAIVRDTQIGLQSWAAGTALVVRDSTFHNSTIDGILIRRGSPHLEGILAYDNPHHGVRVLPALSNPVGPVHWDRITCIDNGFGITLVNFTGSVSNALVAHNTIAGFEIDPEPGQSITIRHATIHDNELAGVSADLDAGETVHVVDSVITGQNNGVWLRQFSTGVMTSTYSNVFDNTQNYRGGPVAGVGSISQDPRYVSDTDLSLRSDSPCIDAASGVDTPAVDVLGVPRPLDGDGTGGAAPDLGAYERVPPGGIPPDAGPPDAGLPDAGPDAGLPDAGPDAGLPDASEPDAGEPDASPAVDAGEPDASPAVDAGEPDASPAVDAGVADAAFPVEVDAGATDEDSGAGGAADAGVAQPPEDGCDCRVGGERARGPSVLGLLAIAMLLFRRRRR